MSVAAGAPSPAYALVTAVTGLRRHRGTGIAQGRRIMPCIHIRAGLYVVLVLLAGAGHAADLISLKEAVTQPQLTADYRFSYGPQIDQFGDLRLPVVDASHPVIVLIHGGCWESRYDLHLMDAMAQRLTERGFATWNLEFRRAGQPGGGWPGTLEDVLLGTDYLANLATRFPLDLARVVVVGHSSGGHLALWLGAQTLWSGAGGRGHPATLRLLGIVALAPVADLEAMYDQQGLGCHDDVADFMGGAPARYPGRYALASPSRLPGIPVPQIIVSGGRDRIIPDTYIRQYVLHARQRGDQVRTVLIDTAGHFEMIAPRTAEWTGIETAIESLFSAGHGE